MTETELEQEAMFKLFKKWYKHLKGNQAAVTVGGLLEIQFCEIHKYIERIDGDGFDGIVLKDIKFQLREKTIVMKRGELIEIKSKSSFVNSFVVAYDNKKKRNKYSWLVVISMDRDGYRTTIIHHDELNEKVIDKKGAGISLNFNPGVRHNHSKPVYSIFTKLFLENEYLNYNLIAS